MTVINIPERANFIIKTLENQGFEAYVVGGCVRDSILGRNPKDWDVCTSATPDQIIGCFPGFQIIETGLKHGTVTVVIEGEAFEVTTFRIDGEYSDSRRPESVEFTKSLKEDLSRRDFTINAMAYNDRIGVMDYFGGFSDLKHHIIRCVGDPEQRFKEDALRILRAVRFDSQLAFSVEPKTRAAMTASKDNLLNISAERVQAEISKILTGVCPEMTLDIHSEVIAVVIPEIKQMIDFDQKNPYHPHDLWRHTLAAVAGVDSHDLSVRLAMFFHDIGKPECMTVDEHGIGHFYGHPDKSVEITLDILKRLKFPADTISDVVTLIKYHDTYLEATPKCAKRLLSKIGEENARRLVKIRTADVKAQTENGQDERIQDINSFEDILKQVIEQKQCFALKDLAVNGWDLISLGMMTGKRVGKTLQRLLELVIDDKIENDKAILLAVANDIMNEEV